MIKIMKLMNGYVIRGDMNYTFFLQIDLHLYNSNQNIIMPIEQY